MTIRSNPPGATVYVDDQEIGETPVSTSFVYYGTRKIQLVKDGYETLTIKHRFAAPWYQVPPLDFFSENVIPYEFRDERILDLEMEPQRVVPVPELVQRAQQLRDSTRSGYTVTPPPAAPGGPTNPALAPPPERYPLPYDLPPSYPPPQ
jgi:hypothetical protein